MSVPQPYAPTSLAEPLPESEALRVWRWNAAIQVAAALKTRPGLAEASDQEIAAWSANLAEALIVELERWQ